MNEYRSVIGTVMLEMADTVDMSAVGEQYSIEEESTGTVYPIVFDTEDQALSTPLGRTVALSIATEADQDGNYRVSPDKPWYSLVGPLPSVRIPSKINMGIWRTLRPELATPERIADDQALVDKVAVSVRDFYQTVARSYREYDVRGYILITDNSPGKSNYLESEIRQFMRDHPEEFSDFIVDKHCCWGGVSGTYGGWGQVGGDWCMVYQSTNNPAKVAKHEFGHNFSMRHTKSRSPDGGMVEYSRISMCAMGDSSKGLCAVQRNRIGFESDEEKRWIQTSQQVLIGPTELDWHSMLPGEKQINIIQVPDAPQVYLSVRRGSDHLFLDEYVGGSPITFARIKPGESRNEPAEPYAVHYLEYKNEIARVDIDLFTNAVTPPAVEIPDDTLPPIPVGTDLSEIHTANWWNPTIPGQGLDIQVRGDFMSLAWYTYQADPPKGSPDYKYPMHRYYVGGASRHDDRIPVVATAWNPTNNDYEEYQAGWVRPYFYNDSEGVLLYDTIHDGRGSIQIKRLFGHSHHECSGIFFDPDNPGEGLTFQAEDAMGLGAGLFYTYGPQVRNYNGNAIPDTTQRWYVMSVTASDDAARYSGNVYYTYGSGFRAKGHYAEEKCGVVTLDFISPGEVQFYLKYKDETGREIERDMIYVRLV